MMRVFRPRILVLCVTVISLISSVSYGEWMYFADRPNNRIVRANLDGSETQTVVSISGPWGVAVDDVSNRLYVTAWDTIYSCNLDGTDFQSVLQIPGASLMEIYVDVAGGKMYWADSVRNVIERANLDGTGIQNIGGGLFTQRMAIDVLHNKVCWEHRTGTGNYGTIKCANLDGTSAYTVVESEHYLYVAGLAIDPVNEHIYFTTVLVNNALQRVDMDGSNRVQLCGTPAGARGLTLDVGAEMVYFGTDDDGIQRTSFGSCVFEPLNSYYAEHIALDPRADCNGNGFPDALDLSDCDGSTWCQDCNSNGLPDACDIPPLNPSGFDCQPNGIPDECEVDCQPNSVPDDCDIATGTSEDCDGDGLPDECDGLTYPAITEQPQAIVTCSGEAEQFSVMATGAPSLAYQWRLDDEPLLDGGHVSGAQTPTLSFDPTGEADNGFYDVVVTNTCGQDVSAAVELVVQPLPSVLQQPGSQSVCEGDPATFAVVASGGGGPADADTMGNSTNWSSGPRLRGNVYAATQTRILTGIEHYLNITTPGQIVYYVYEADASDGPFTVIAEDTLPTSGIGEGFYASGSMAVTLSAGKYYLIGAGWPDTHTYFWGGTHPQPTLFGESVIGFSAPWEYPLPSAPTPASALVFRQRLQTVDAVTYQWRLGANPIPGAVEDSYSIDAAAPSDAGNYDVEITDECGSTFSDVASLSVLNATTCDDENECTDDGCVNAQCTYTDVPDDTACSGGFCDTGQCIPHFTIGGAIYTDVGDPLGSGEAGVEVCVSCPAAEPCDLTAGSQGLWQIADVPTGICDVTVTKAGYSFQHVVDGVPGASPPITITVDSDHQAENQSIQFLAIYDGCQNNEDCDDSVDCTVDTCNQQTGECVFAPNDGLCPDDSLFCTGSEYCDGTQGCRSSGDPCTELGLICDEIDDECDCDDPSDCEDGVTCTDNTCVAGTCTYTPNDNLCPDDGLFCNGTEYCDATNDCSHSGNPCDPPSGCNEETDQCDAGAGACCIWSIRGCLASLEQDFCENTLGGLYAGDGTTCPDACDLGACCYADGTCADLIETHCLDLAGLWEGPGTGCDPNPCPQPPTGACCHADGSCTVTTEFACPGVWQGADTTCDPDPCPQPIGACCVGEICVPDQTEPDCRSVSGHWAGPDVGCAPNPCVGACCIGAVCVPDQTESDCLSVPGQWAGIFTLCPETDSDLCPICDDGDVDGDGDVDLLDFAEFQMCFELPYDVSCKCVDMNNDIDIDRADFGLFEPVLEQSGP